MCIDDEVQSIIYLMESGSYKETNCEGSLEKAVENQFSENKTTADFKSNTQPRCLSTSLPLRLPTKRNYE